MIKVLHDFMEYLKLCHYPTKFDIQFDKHFCTWVIIVLDCHMIPEEHLMKGSYDFMDEKPSW